jgi:integrase
MASIYPKGKKIYISWYDFALQKNRNKSLGLTNTKDNMAKAKLIAADFEKELQKEKEKFATLGITRNTIHYAFKHFLSNNETKHPKTIRDYFRFYNKFIETFPEQMPCTTITKLSVEKWLNQIKKLKLKRNSIFGYYKQLNHFLNFLFEYNYLPMFKINRDVKPKPEIVEKIIIEIEDLALIFYMLALCEKNENFKNMITILFYTGLRASDVLSLKIEDVNIKETTLRYYSPKKKIYREVAFHQNLVPIFEGIKQQREKGKAVDYKNVESLQRAIRRYFEQIGLTGKRYTSRSFRKTFITIAKRRGMDETTVKELVGHAHTSVTDKFYNKIDTEQMKNELMKYMQLNELPYDSIKDKAGRIVYKRGIQPKN